MLLKRREIDKGINYVSKQRKQPLYRARFTPHGTPILENFRLEYTPVPEPSESQVLLRTESLSLDPYMRGRMNDAPSYAEPVRIDQVMVGATICQVEASRHPGYTEGEWVLAYSGWQDFALSDGL